MLLKLILLCLFLATMFGCGGQDGQNTAVAGSPDTTPIKNATLSEYQFAATVEGKMGNTPFPVAIGDTVTGTFSFDPKLVDNFILPTQGGYFQSPPATAQVNIGSVIFNADPDDKWLGYVLRVNDNDASVAPTRDEFSWDADDSALAASFGLDRVSVTFSLTDLTATALNGDAIPTNINLDDYTSGYLYISASKGNAASFYFYSKIKSIIKLR
ncbi:hypothetical protein KP003_03510 [Geomonas nitrogeniifigens]|uniref:hypothetical protein n=1 Tax=Geomonas diazotrophica TaxID=2843197 RepID=UPI001C2C7B8C|nr:hypothetical protein [Geomonas nitrogeniifigens]QXE87482.1 hypothetical protein KP003_03510 [Geomonas nitrogeniifigens]